MKLTLREKKLLRFWPLLWPAFFYLIFFQPHRPGWARYFFFALSLLVGLIALAFGLRSLRKIFRKPNPRPSALATSAFTLIELLVVIAIMGVLAALIAPTVKNMMKGDASVSASRQILDDVGRARQLAIANRTTVYMVFVDTNFWQDPARPATSPNQWNLFAADCPDILKSTTVSNLYAAQWNGYLLYSLRQVGDQPGAPHPTDLLGVRTLPPGSFFAPIKFAWPAYPAAPFVIRSNYAMYGFLRTNAIPFPTTTALTNASYASALTLHAFPTVPYIAFNYLGQLAAGDGSLLPYDEFLPLSFGSIAPSKTQTIPSAVEQPPGNSTNISFNLIHIDRLTGRARLEHED